MMLDINNEWEIKKDIVKHAIRESELVDLAVSCDERRASNPEQLGDCGSVCEGPEIG